mmetsp:Transcript_8933/g.33693  ORF Transcript_8933/g.33693 Transcript_8933/m.33693 type:complete len:219 (+) Transcript_8933:172-828(+)
MMYGPSDHHRRRDILEEGAGPVQGLLDDGHVRLDEGLDEHTGGGPHREAAVLKFHERPLLVDAVLRKLEGVEATVARHASHVLGVLGLDGADHEENLKEAGGRGGLERLDAVLGREGVAQAVHFLCEDAGGGEHANAAVLKLRLAQLREVVAVGEAEGVEADVSRELSVEVRRLVGEGDGRALLGRHAELSPSDAARRSEGRCPHEGGGEDAEAEHFS